ncbi:hypothetical protein EDB83DRAFT_2285743 [Lactarius deliciosus]|nr:hypothetical protein EDB83DRAFT_2285743 [Lactarius deliciosus]
MFSSYYSLWRQQRRRTLGTSQLLTFTMNEPAITVHAMFPTAYHQTHPSQAVPHIYNADTLLARGRTIARAGCGLSGWRSYDTISTRGCFLRNAFTYVFPPPLAPTTVDVPSNAVKEWNTRPSESEIFSIAGLRPFESTLVGPPPCHPAVPLHDQKLDDPPQSPKKHVKVNVDVGPLDELIPLPHYIPAPLDVRTPLPRSSPPDTYPTFAPIPPQTTSSVEDLLSSIYARVAWLIPVRGVPPWNDVSRASVALGHFSALGPRHLPASDIFWTHDALRQFWTFLCSCSETLGSVTGPLSLSFHTAPRSSLMRSQQVTTSPGASPCHLANNEFEMTSDPEPLMSIVRALTDIDYVKVYCDAPWAMSVRRALAQWTYEEDGCAGGAVGGIQFLEFAKLVLVNETGEGVLVL